MGVESIARRSGACAEIISLLSLTLEAVRSLGWEGMARLYAPVVHWMKERLFQIRYLVATLGGWMGVGVLVLVVVCIIWWLFA